MPSSDLSLALLYLLVPSSRPEVVRQNPPLSGSAPAKRAPCTVLTYIETAQDSHRDRPDRRFSALRYPRKAGICSIRGPGRKLGTSGAGEFASGDERKTARTTLSCRLRRCACHALASAVWQPRC